MDVNVRAAIWPPIETQRLHIRAPTAADAGALFALHSDPDYIAFVGERVSRDKFDSIFARELDGTSTILALPICERVEGQIVGECAVVPSTVREVEIVIALLPGHRGNRYSAEIARALIDTCLASSAIDTVIACVEDTNARAIRLVEMIGMTRDGVTPRSGKAPLRYEAKRVADA